MNRLSLVMPCYDPRVKLPYFIPLFTHVHVAIKSVRCEQIPWNHKGGEAPQRYQSLATPN